MLGALALAAPKAGVLAPPKPNAELLAAPNAGVEAATPPNAGVLKPANRDGVLAAWLCPASNSPNIKVLHFIYLRGLID